MNGSVDDRYVVGCDIGGANLKLADTRGQNCSVAFPMWLKFKELPAALLALLKNFPDRDEIAVTMTGELADCFPTRRDGVQEILAQVMQIVAPEKTWVYAVGNYWLSPAAAIDAPWDVAASNWYALATWIGSAKFFSHPRQPVDLVLDIGSTTVDIIPMKSISDGTKLPATNARTDRQRLELGQLVYTGLERTPIAAIVRDVTLHGIRCPVMAERFATSDDCYVVLGLTAESPRDAESADGRPRTVANAHARIARMIGEDSETLSLESTRYIAEQVIEAQASQIAESLDRNLPMDRRTSFIAVAGHGRALAERALSKLANRELNITWLEDLIDTQASRCAPALAVAALRANTRLTDCITPSQPPCTAR